MLGPFTKQQLDILYGDVEDLVYFMKQTADTFSYVYVNPACGPVFQKQLVGTTVDESMPPLLAHDIKKHYKIALDSGHLHTYRDHSLFSEFTAAIETDVKPLCYNDEQFILAVSKNVTKQKKIEEDYLFYQSLIVNSVDPMIMITADYKVFDMNPAYEYTFGLRKDEWVGRSARELPLIDRQSFEAIRQTLEVYEPKRTSSSVISRKKGDGTMGKFSASYSPISQDGVVRAYHIILRELTNELQLKEELKKAENILNSYKEALNFAALVAIWKPSGAIHFINDNFKGTTGYEKEELLGMNISEIGQSMISNGQFNDIREVVMKGEIWRGELKCSNKTGGDFWVDSTIIPLMESEGSVGQLLSIMFDITDRKRLEEQLHFMAYHDSLTNLPNRRFMVQEFSRMKTAADEKGEWIALLFLDGDNFKEVNDQYGHDIGDEFIHQFSNAIKMAIRKDDLAARVGGDEFLIALPSINSTTGEEQILSIIDRIKAELKKGWKIADVHFSPTTSIGAAIYPADAQNLEDLVKKADHALYAAKTKGKNFVCFYSEDGMEEK
ncbi:sensor domain-containing diguanylate cyclase [Planococcus sp. YIM B11945]|uniref:sensor domain-containing diguanylate cyclase n=1 Tax=Planococcus sp. YIM B11945 TaxID=3435410 RepID=UPI003D7D48F7